MPERLKRWEDDNTVMYYSGGVSESREIVKFVGEVLRVTANSDQETHQARH